MGTLGPPPRARQRLKGSCSSFRHSQLAAPAARGIATSHKQRELQNLASHVADYAVQVRLWHAACFRAGAPASFPHRLADLWTRIAARAGIMGIAGGGPPEPPGTNPGVGHRSDRRMPLDLFDGARPPRDELAARTVEGAELRLLDAEIVRLRAKRVRAAQAIIWDRSLQEGLGHAFAAAREEPRQPVRVLADPTSGDLIARPARSHELIWEAWLPIFERHGEGRGQAPPSWPAFLAAYGALVPHRPAFSLLPLTGAELRSIARGWRTPGAGGADGWLPREWKILPLAFFDRVLPNFSMPVKHAGVFRTPSLSSRTRPSTRAQGRNR